jgi:hypothetical protein
MGKTILYFFTSIFWFFCLVSLSSQAFDRNFIEKAINGEKHLDDAVIYDPLQELKTYNSLLYFNSDFTSTTIRQRYIDYGNYNVLVVTEIIDSVEYVRDFLLLKKQNSETYLANGPVEINGHFDWEITVEISHQWEGAYTDNIVRAFKVNPQTKKIELVKYASIRLYNEEWGHQSNKD